MVLGISLRSKKRRDSKASAPPLRVSPSLPDLHDNQTPLDFPSNLLSNTVGATSTNPLARSQSISGGRAPIEQPGGANIPYHRPWRERLSHDTPAGAGTGGSQSVPASPSAPSKHSIAALYASNEPPTFSRSRPVSSHAPLGRRPSHSRIIPAFNVMLMGATGSGKTSLARLLLETSTVSSGATSAQLKSVEMFVQAAAARETTATMSASLEVEEGPERLTLSITDTPGLRFQRGAELDLERTVTSIIRSVEARYAETLSEETKVVRQPDQGSRHIHVCLYFIVPEAIQSIMVLPDAAPRPSVEVIAAPPVPQSPRKSSEKDKAKSLRRSTASATGATPQLALREAEINVIKRLSARMNVVPIISRADTMTDERLEEVKSVVKRDLQAAGFTIGEIGAVSLAEETERRYGKGSQPQSDSDEEEEAAEPAAKVIRIRHSSGSGRLSRSRSRSRIGAADEGATMSALGGRLVKLFPLTVMSPDPFPLRVNWESSSRVNGHGLSTPVVASPPPSAFRAAALPTSAVPSPSTTTEEEEDPYAEMRGKYVRRYRWGTVDVLDQTHCDFVPLRHLLFGPKMRVFRKLTHEVLYEKFRTEKLLVRRATHNISAEARGRLLRDVGGA